MKKIFILALSVCAVFNVQAQQVIYDENAEIRTVPDFIGVEVSGTISLYLSQGTENAVAISAGDAQYNNKIKTEVDNGILKISVDGGFWNGMGWSNRKLKAYVSIINASKLHLSGASLTTINGVLTSDALKIDLSGASEVRGALNVKQLNVDLSGASVGKLTGNAGSASIDASGASKLSAYELIAEQCKADASGASSVRISVKNAFNASASGGSNVYYKGNPTNISVNSSAGASIKKRVDNGD